jgi:hypothetical protein
VWAKGPLRGLFKLMDAGDLRFYDLLHRIMSYPDGDPMVPASEFGRAVGGNIETLLDTWVDANGISLRRLYVGDLAVGIPSALTEPQPGCGPSNFWGKGHPEHHANGIVGFMSQTDYNRDPQQHCWHSFVNGSGLPTDIKERIAANQFQQNGYGPLGVPDGNGGMGVDYSNMVPNEWHAVYAKYNHNQKELLDALGVCAWMWPFIASPLKERGYEGDISMMSQFYSCATGDTKSTLELDYEGERMWVLHRFLTMLWMKAYGQAYTCYQGTFPLPGGTPGGSANMRLWHDWLIPLEFYEFGDGSPGTEWYEIMSLFYAEWGCDEEKGWPTAATYDKYGMADVKAAASAAGLLP